jgi:hypothetical protein
MRHATPRNALADCFLSDMRAMVAARLAAETPAVPGFGATVLARPGDGPRTLRLARLLMAVDHFASRHYISGMA